MIAEILHGSMRNPHSPHFSKCEIPRGYAGFFLHRSTFENLQTSAIIAFLVRTCVGRLLKAMQILKWWKIVQSFAFCGTNSRFIGKLPHIGVKVT